ncbi:MAG: ElyC/SanA/YdcF family protein [Leptolyngbyaceae cyanobacterium]
MRCPKCKHGSVQKHGARVKFVQPYQCKNCQHIFYPSVRAAIRWSIGILLVVGLSPWWVNRALRLLVARPDAGEPVDAIVVVGRGHDYRQRRTQMAVELWQEGRAPHIFMSGVTDAPVLVGLAKDMGVPDANVSGEACSITTWENAFYTRRYLPFDPSTSEKPKILLVTDSLHIGRTALLYRNLGFEVLIHPIGLNFAQWRVHIRREFAAIMYYIGTRQILPPQPEKLERAEKEAARRIDKWYCLDMEKAHIPKNRWSSD